MSFEHLLDILIRGDGTCWNRNGALTGSYGPPSVNFPCLSKLPPTVFQLNSYDINQYNSAAFGPIDLGRYYCDRWMFAVRACWQNPSVLVS